jgi:hypothetical protein
MKGANYTHRRSYRDQHSVEEETETIVTKKVKKKKEKKVGFFKKVLNSIFKF